ncbi:MAG TPA: ATP-binding protein [Pyrinomonadaceae bacterium]|nr:ATP-binding protein [Pyrinomonadaceae bacterium]
MPTVIFPGRPLFAMTPLEVLQLIGFSTAAALHLWMGGLLFRRRHGLGRIEHVLTWLALSVGVWHGCNLLLALHSMLGLTGAGWEPPLRVVNTLAVSAITLSYSLLLHLHLHLWADSRGRALNALERLRVYLSYIPALFLPVALLRLWQGPYAPMFDKLNFLLLPFALWATYCLCLVAVTDFLIARSTQRASERRLMRTLAASFVGIAFMIFVVYALRVGKGSELGEYLQSIANLGSLVPSALLAYHIYRYRYLELIIKESLIAATFAAVVLVVYLYGIRTAGLYITARYGVRAGVIESILILTLALVAAPLRRWLDRKFHQLFEREAALYRDVVTRIGGHAGRYAELPALLKYIEEQTASALGLRRVRLLVTGDDARPSASGGGDGGARDVERIAGGDVGEVEGWEAEIAERVRAWGGAALEGDPVLRKAGFQLAFPLSRENREVGLMLVDGSPDALTHDVMSVLEVLAGQVAIAVEDCRLVEENVRLERRLARGERLAALGQMAATVAHEVKNPLSAIKSIAQVMREDEKLKVEYARDLELIVGETDRLSRSVTQLLSFARGAPPVGSPVRTGSLIGEVVKLTSAEAESRGVSLRNQVETASQTNGGDVEQSKVADSELSGACASALRDALANLILNALQATPEGGAVTVEARATTDALVVTVTDEGGGVPEELRERIWEPFFTTKQRGTGLGLAIVRRRLEEVGGTARLAPRADGEGARFELTVPRAHCTT